MSNERTYTQDDLDRIIRKRVARVNGRMEALELENTTLQVELEQLKDDDVGQPEQKARGFAWLGNRESKR